MSDERCPKCGGNFVYSSPWKASRICTRCSTMWILEPVWIEKRASSEFDGVVDWFSREMILKLEKNNWKGGWGEERTEWLLTRAQQEFDELKLSLDSDDVEKIIGECADVSNFLMMIADNLRRE